MKSIFSKLFNPSTKQERLFVAIVLLAILLLGSYGYLDAIKEFLSSNLLTLTMDDFSLSLYTVVKGLFIIVSLLWFASLISSIGARYIGRIEKIGKSNRTLLIKAFYGIVYFIIFLVWLQAMKIDLTLFAFLGGAVGIGIGLGLQKITSNFVSGVILLFEKSFEEGDLIELSDGTYGFARQIRARYTIVQSFDGKEVIIPNEDFITSRVTNWTHSNDQGRAEIPISISYSSDAEKAREIILQTANEHPRCSKQNPAQCFLMKYGESSLDLRLYVWVDDVTEGRTGVQSDIMFSLLKKFAENNIVIPYPQRDVHLMNEEKSK